MPGSSAAPEKTAVRRRLVCFLSGFDPRGPAHYHALYSSAAQAQSRLSGWSVEVGPRGRAEPHLATWLVQTDTGEQQVETHYEFLRWDDIVRRQWPAGWWGAWRATVFSSWHLWRGGVMWRALKTSWPSFMVMAAPGLLMAALALLLSWGSLALGLARGQVHALGLLVAPLLLGLGWLAWRTERRAHMGWLVRSMACLVRQGRGQTPDLEARLDGFAQHLRAVMRTAAVDEVLVVGHSSGAMLAMSVVARALREEGPPPLRGDAPSLALLTLGHCAPVLAYQPAAQAFRRDLATLVDSPRLCWVDYGAPPDGCCFPLVDPSAGLPLHRARPHPPRLLNPRFAALYTPQAYKQLRADHFRCHFQYLMAGELTGDYDYIGMTAGPLSLARRHDGRKSITDFRQFQLFGGAGR
jgi:pimeloyl-ACP methyl ester carboxylesterase